MKYSNFSIINSRDVRIIGYDPEKGICIVWYNHLRGGKNVYYHGVTEEEYQGVRECPLGIANGAEIIFKNHHNTSVLTG